MKPLLLIVVCLLLCPLIPSALVAQTDTAAAVAPIPEISVPGTWEVVAAGGYTWPFEPSEFNDQFDPSFNFGGGIAYSLPPGEAGYGEISFLVQYYNVLFAEDAFREANGLPANAVIYGYPGDILTGMLQFRGVYATTKDRIAPYFTAGIGYYYMALPALGVEGAPAPIVEEFTSSSVGWSVGLGVDVPVMDRLTLFADGKFILGVTGDNGHKLFTAGGGIRFRF